jgi:hypothetical protein
MYHSVPAEVFEIMEARLRERRGIVVRALGLIVPVWVYGCGPETAVVVCGKMRKSQFQTATARVGGKRERDRKSSRTFILGRYGVKPVSIFYCFAERFLSLWSRWLYL